MSKKLDTRAYLNWYGSSAYPFRDTVILDDLVYICEWIPLEVEIAKQLTQKRIDEKEAKLHYKSGTNDVRFQFKILIPHPGMDILNYRKSETETSETRSMYYHFQMKDDFTIFTSKNTSVSCGSFTFERGISNFPVARFDLYFPEYQGKENYTIHYHDRIFSKQTLQFDLKNEWMKKIPKLII